MKVTLLASLAAIALSSTLSAQTVLLREDFTVSVPPAGWSQVKHNSAAQGWIKSADNRAWHEDEPTSVGATDDELISPVINCTGHATVTATFQTELYWSTYLANHPNSQGDGENDLYVRVNGGAWTEVWTDTRTVNSNDQITVDISAVAAGQANVEIAFRFYGTYAQEWWVDWVQVDGSGSAGPTLAKSGSCPGPVTLTVTNATPSASVAYLYGPAGSFTQNNPNKPCLGTTLGISAPTLGAVVGTNGSGGSSIAFNAPAGACGLTVQVVDLSSCLTTNTVTL